MKRQGIAIDLAATTEEYEGMLWATECQQMRQLRLNKQIPGMTKKKKTGKNYLQGKFQVQMTLLMNSTKHTKNNLH